MKALFFGTGICHSLRPSTWQGSLSLVFPAVKRSCLALFWLQWVNLCNEGLQLPLPALRVWARVHLHTSVPIHASQFSSARKAEYLLSALDRSPGATALWGPSGDRVYTLLLPSTEDNNTFKYM